MDIALLRGYMSTYFGWRLNVTNNTRPAGLRNFPMQAHGAEMLRIACCLATERGVRVCAPVHDALLIEAPISLIGDACRPRAGRWLRPLLRRCVQPCGSTPMSRSRAIRTATPPRGQAMWDRVTALLSQHTSSNSSTFSASSTPSA